MKEQNEQSAENKTTDVVAAQARAVAVQQPNYITAMLESMKQDFLAANDGLDLDFVYMGEWLVIDKKGNFVEREGKDDAKTCVSYGDNIDIVIGYGEKRWSLWGLEKSPEDGQLIVAEKEKEDAEAALTEWLEENPQAQERYNLSSLELRYMAYVVPVQTIKPDDMPKIYLMSFSPTGTIAFGKWAYAVYQGKYKAVGIPNKTGVNKIVTRLSTSEKSGRGNTSWIGIDFEAVGMFNPADYGITDIPQTPTEVPNQA